ncbi:MAG: excinuclease ABC subunit C [Ignavibacteriae bacterium]|nr:MAG: excinuclease ABC subunit C [Ignavibacteriota bacterium]
MEVNEILRNKLDNLTTSPGIYQFKDKAGKIIYVGKAKNLRSRVKSYFTAKPTGPRLIRMISLISDLETIAVDSEVESLILEMNMIKELKPRYNVNLKDDKTYPYIVITKELFPRVFPTRKRRNDGSKYFGPYTDVGNMRQSLKLLRDIFMIRNCNLNLTQQSIENKKFKECLEYHIHKCEAPCIALVTAKKYNEMIKEIEKVLNGKTGTLINELEQRMADAAMDQRFEEAALIRNKIKSLEVYTSRQKVVSEDMLDKDVFGFVKEADEACAMILNIRDGKVIGKRHFYLDTVEDKSDSEILESVLFRYYSENNFIPDEIYLQNELVDQDAFSKWLHLKLEEKRKINFVIPQKGEKHKLISMVRTNAQYMLDELKLQRLKREFIPHSVTALKRDLRLTALPRRIECFDISHVQGTDTVASMVVFYDGKPRKNDYRKYKLQTILDEVGRPDDFASMREVIYRRYRHYAEKNIEEPVNIGTKILQEINPEVREDNSPSTQLNNEVFDETNNPPSTDLVTGEAGVTNTLPMPDLIVIDGGKGQLSSAVKVLTDLGIKSQNIIGLAKRLEEVFLPGMSDAQSIPKTSSGLKLLQRVRDEAHRFAITYHRQLRNKRTIHSELDDIKGIGEKTRQKLLTEFGSVDNIKQMVENNYDEFEKKAGKKVAERLKEAFSNKKEE